MVFLLLSDETEYEYSGSEEEADELNEDEGEPRLHFAFVDKIWVAPKREVTPKFDLHTSRAIFGVIFLVMHSY